METSFDFESEALAKLRQVLGNPSAKWTSEGQRLAVRHVVERRGDLLAVLATGAGKSMLAILPALLDLATVTVVVVPLRSLLLDWSRRLNEFGVRHHVYTAAEDRSHIPSACNLVLVLVDQARKPDFRHAIDVLDRSRPVRRIILDEIHYMLTHDSFRNSLRHMYELRTKPCQFVLLSATVPPTSVASLREGCLMTPNSMLVRTDTVRPELQYILEHPFSDTNAMLQRVCEIVQYTQPQFSEKDRGLIFVPYKTLLGQLVNTLRCPAYHGGDEITDQERSEACDRWMRASSFSDAWMVCTGAFAAGNDYPHVRVVIHAGTPYDFSELSQAQGRAGRDRVHALACILPLSQSQVHLDHSEHKGHPALERLLYKPTTANDCIRAQVSSHCDGRVDLNCHSVPGAQLCSRCLSSRSADLKLTGQFYPAASRLLQHELLTPDATVTNGSLPLGDVFEQAVTLSRTKKCERKDYTANYADQLYDALSQYKTLCIYCLVSGKRTVNHHDIMQCDTLQPVRAEYLSFRQGIYYAPPLRKICFKCHVPQLNDKLHPTFLSKADKKNCIFPDLLAPLAYAVFITPALADAAAAYFATQWHDIAQFLTWLLSPPVTPHASNIVALYMWWTSL